MFEKDDCEEGVDFMKRIMAAIMCVVLLSIFSFPVYALDTIHSNLNVDSNDLILSSNKYTNIYLEKHSCVYASLDEFMNIGVSDIVESYCEHPEWFATPYSEEDLYVLKNLIIDVSDEMVYCSNDSVVVNDTFNSNLEILTNEPYITGVLCLAEGLTTNEITAAVSAKTFAENFAEEIYPNDGETYQDSLRHFSWNYKMAYSITKEKARIVANNYEWSRVLKDAIERSYTQRYNEAINRGETAEEAADTAASATMYTIPSLKQQAVRLCEASISVFTSLFENAAIRDLHNNCYGRYYGDIAESDTSQKILQIFNMSRTLGELINSDDSVTYDHQWCVWDWDWYT